MTIAPINTVAIIGIGIMGSGLAAEWAANGRTVTFFARTEERAAIGRERANAALATLEQGGLLSATDRAAASSRIQTATDLAQAVHGADLVQESVPEQLPLKQQIFRELDTLCPTTTILASNTSGLPITQIAAGLSGAGRVIGMHYLNPPHLMPPVEVIPGEQTAPAVIERVRSALLGLDKSPLIVRREVPGFLWNRLQFALIREAFWLVENGVASMEDVDLAMRRGLGRRWSIAGPFASIDLGGIDTMSTVGSYLFPELSNVASTTFFDEALAGGNLGAKTGQGFQPWPAEKLAATVARRDRLLATALHEDRADTAPAQETTPNS